MGDGKFYATKYALADGKINEFEGTLAGDGEYVYSGTPGSWQAIQYKVGVGAFRNVDDAIKAAMKMRERKIASLQKQLDKVMAMDFSRRG